MNKILIIFSLVFLGGCATPSEERIMAEYKTRIDDYELCKMYFRTWQGAARSQEFRYKWYRIIVGEKERRELDCYIFPELKGREPYMEARIKLYEEQGSW
jgi:hypothetical protein